MAAVNIARCVTLSLLAALLIGCGAGGDEASTGVGSTGGVPGLLYGSVTIEWPANPDAEQVTHYIISTQSGGTTVRLVTLSVAGANPDLTKAGANYSYTGSPAELGITQTGTYEIRVQARNFGGDSPPSEPAVVTL